MRPFRILFGLAAVAPAVFAGYVLEWSTPVSYSFANAYTSNKDYSYDVTGDSILIYFLRTSAESLIVKREPGFTGLGGGGTTRRIGSGTISEVYVESLLRGGTIGNMQTMINLAFHEAMHNKLQAGKELHNDGGLAADRNWPEDTLNDTNIRKMRAALATSVIQDTQYLSLQYV